MHYTCEPNEISENLKTYVQLFPPFYNEETGTENLNDLSKVTERCYLVDVTSSPGSLLPESTHQAFLVGPLHF